MEHFGMSHVLSFGLREHTTYIFINVDGSLLRLTISISYCLLRFNGPVANSVIVDSTQISHMYWYRSMRAVRACVSVLQLHW